jgi:glycosyltransferase involved in cell wall biosynthesis
MNIIYTIHGLSPNLSMGGPSRIVALIIEELSKFPNHLIKPYIFTNYGLFDESTIRDIYLPQSKFNLRIKKILGSSDTFGAFIKLILFSKLLPSKPGDSKKLKEILEFSNLRSEKFWKNWKSKKEDDCIVHSHLNIGAVPFLKSREPKKHRIIATYHSKGSLISDYGSSWNLKKYNFEKMIKDYESYELKNADVITFPSKGAKRLMQNEYPGILEKRDVRIIHNGIDCDKIENILKDFGSSPGDNSEGKFLIINIAQHVRQKRIDILLKAVARLKDEINQIKLINIGDGALLEKNKSLASELGIKDLVHFLGPKKNEEVIRMIAECDAFVMPSENVIFDLVTLEAMAVGKPIIVSADGGNFECIRDGIDGILTKVHDIQSVVEAIRFLYQNRDKAKALAHSAQKRVRTDFSASAMFKKYLKLYEEKYP